MNGITIGFEWLKTNKRTTALITTVYALSVILTHDFVQKISLSLQKSVGIVNWNTIFLIIGFLTGIVLFLLAYRRISAHEYSFMMWMYAAMLTIIVMLGFSWLMVKYVESIHFAQYAVLACLLVALFGRTIPAVLVAVFVGMIDELFQFLYLYKGMGYYDMNDVVLNCIGSVTGMYLVSVVLGAPGSGIDPLRWKILTRRVLGSWVILFSLLASLFATGVLGVFADTGRLSFYKNRTEEQGLPERRIRTTRVGNDWYRLLPPEGVSILFFLPLLFSGLDRQSRLENKND